jgi:SAM-dependent methyltransferase
MATVVAPDLTVIKKRQQDAWASGDYSAVATMIVLIAERLAEAAEVNPGEKVLDVATGSGNAALAAARYGCQVVGVDYVPELLERARARAEVERLEVKLVEGDAEQLPFADGSFDVVLSCLGSMFAPDQERTAAELLRVCRPGGRIALASWTPSSVIGELFKVLGKHVPPPPGLYPPSAWGTEDRLRELCGDRIVGLRSTTRVFTFRFGSAEGFAHFFRTNYGPIHKAFAGLDGGAQEALYSDLVALARARDDEAGESIALRSEYLETVAVTA